MITARTSEPPNAPSPGIYRHYKGSMYQVLGMARHSESEEWLVVYQALYGERGFWLRPLTLWLESVTSGDEQGQARFRLIEPATRDLRSIVETG